MTKLPHAIRKTVLIACCLVLLLSALALALNAQTRNQRSQEARRNEIINQLQAMPDQSLRVVGNEDSPLRIVAAKVKEIPAALFTQLTGRSTDLQAVASVPEVTLVNTSGQTIIRFLLDIRDPDSRTSRGIVQSRIALKPGDTYVVTREHFGRPESRTVVGEDGRIRQISVPPGMDSEQRWLQFAALSNLFITIAKVDFEDGTSWIIREGGEVR